MDNRFYGTTLLTVQLKQDTQSLFIADIQFMKLRLAATNLGDAPQRIFVTIYKIINNNNIIAFFKKT